VQYFSSDIYITSHSVFLHVSIHKVSSSGNRTKATSHKTKLAILCIFRTFIYLVF